MPASTKRRSRYSPHPSLDYARNVVAKMKANTGRSLAEWIALVKKNGPTTKSDRAAWLRAKHGLGMNSAGYIAECSVGGGEAALDDAKYLAQAERDVEAMYAGAKAALRPMYERLLDVMFALGPDIRVCPCSTMVPVFRRFAIAQIKPSTRTRIDVGFALGKHKGKLPARLVDTGGAAKKDRITHRIEITAPEQIDAELCKWLKTAYELDVE